MFHGHGKYYFDTDGKVYEGDFTENKIEGQGILMFADGNKYEGQFFDGMMHGYGQWTEKDGSYY